VRRAGSPGKAPIIVGAWDERTGIALGQEQVAEKSNEITAIPRLLTGIDIRGAIVTTDAMGCQKESTRLIAAGGADYMLALKGNHGLAEEEMRSFMEDAIANAPERLAFHETLDKGHGRLETRRCWQSADLDWFEDRKLWTNLKSVCMVESARSVGGATTTERRLFLCSMAPDAAKAMEIGRGHWGIENRLHHKLDVQLGEDLSRARSANAPRNLALMRRAVLNILGRDAQGRGLRRCQKNAAWNPAYLEAMLAGND
jgi:predicted transposase YbfD/YdcC